MSERPSRPPLELVLDEARALALEAGGERAGRAVRETASLERDIGPVSYTHLTLPTNREV